MKTTQLRLGFTLIELLVVISIVSLLISILLPALRNARQAARTAVCLSNTRQLALSLELYIQENKGYFPVITRGAGDKPETNIGGTLAGLDLISQDEIEYQCPTFDGEIEKMRDDIRIYTANGLRYYKAFPRTSRGTFAGKPQSYPLIDPFRPELSVYKPGSEFHTVDALNTKNMFGAGIDQVTLDLFKAAMGTPYSDPSPYNGVAKKGIAGGCPVFGANTVGPTYLSIRHAFATNGLYWDGHAATIPAEQLWETSDILGGSNYGSNPDCHWDGR